MIQTVNKKSRKEETDRCVLTQMPENRTFPAMPQGHSVTACSLAIERETDRCARHKCLNVVQS